jgi:methylmalonyl-CoA/ethylmalonyl-CoA epimerase
MRNKPMFTGVVQVGLVVKDCMASVKRYADDYGIGPWAIYNMDPSAVQDMTARGEITLSFPEKGQAMLAACANIGDVQIELIQPLDDKSIYAEWLRQHGDGIHHILFNVEDFDKTVGFFQRKGIGVLQGGAVRGTKFAYFDTVQELGLIAEIYKLAPGMTSLPEPDDVYPKST